MPKNDELWVLSGIFKEINNMRLVYNYIDVIMTLITIITIVLNLELIKQQ